MSWIIFGLVLFLPYGVQGTLTPSGTVAVDCGGQQTFTCNVTGITTNSIAGWTIMGLDNITASGSNGLTTANNNPRITTSTGAIVPISTITIADFTMSDNGGTVQCINAEDASDQGTAILSVEPLPPPSNVVTTTAGHDCTVITLQWDKPDTPSDINSTVSCTPSSTACGACTSSPCNITDLALNTEYTFTVTLNSGMCGSSMSTTTTARTMGKPQLQTVGVEVRTDTSVEVTWEQLPSTTPATFITITYCLTSTPNCGDSTNCTSPCGIDGLMSGKEYNFTVTPFNNCGVGDAKSVTRDITPTTSPPPTTPGLPIVVIVVPIVAAIILVILIVIIVIVVVIWCMKEKHGVKACPCIKKKEKESGGDGDVIYEDPEKDNDNIKMQSSPAYQTVSSVCGTKDDSYYSGMTDGVKMEPSPAYQTVS